MTFARLPYDNGMPNAVAGNLHCLAVQCAHLDGRKSTEVFGVEKIAHCWRSQSNPVERGMW